MNQILFRHAVQSPTGQFLCRDGRIVGEKRSVANGEIGEKVASKFRARGRDSHRRRQSANVPQFVRSEMRRSRAQALNCTRLASKSMSPKHTSKNGSGQQPAWDMRKTRVAASAWQLNGYCQFPSRTGSVSPASNAPTRHECHRKEMTPFWLRASQFEIKACFVSVRGWRAR